MSVKILARVSALSLAMLLAACGGGDDSTPLVNVGGNTGDSTGGGDSDNDNTDGSGEDTPPDNEGGTTSVAALLGTGEGGNFNQGQIFSAPPSIQADGKHSFRLTLADPETKQPWLKSGQNVTYTSPCIDAEMASVEGPVSPDSGIITATYTSSGCYGSDLIHAFVGDSIDPAASGTMTIAEPMNLELALGDYDAETGAINAVNTIKTTSSSISKYGQARLTVGIVNKVDGSLQTGIPFTVNFESICATGLNKSSFAPASVDTTTGIAETIFEAGACSANPQRIEAKLQDADGKVSIATVDIGVDEAQAFQLVAALPDPMSIAPSLLSEEGRETVSSIKFTLKDQFGSNGDPIPFVNVEFTIDTAGKAEFVNPLTNANANSITVKTNSQGVATAQVRAKKDVDHDEFRVIATYGNLIAYSKPIVINSMLPYQPKFSLSSQNFAPNTQGINGVESGLTLYVADINGNRVRGNTYVNFKTDQGSIDPDCVVVDGRCNVTWESLRTDGKYAIITASTNGRTSDLKTGTIESSVTLLMSTNENVFLEFVQKGGLNTGGTEYCATTWVELPGEGSTKFSPPVGTTVSFTVDTGELVVGAPASKTISSNGELVSNESGYEVCTKVKPEVTEVTNGEPPTTLKTYLIELSASVQTPDDGASDTKSTSDAW